MRLTRRCRELKTLNQQDPISFYPRTPIANGCVFHSGQVPFTEWSELETECYLGFISVVVEVACKNQWTAEGIVERVIYKRDIYGRAAYGKKDIDLITALLNENCPSLKPHRKALNDRRKELIQ